MNGTNWTWLARTEPGQTNLLVPMLSEAESFYRLGDTNDLDADSLSDLFEQWVSYSSPITNDTDGDGLLDGWEWTHFGGFAPTDSGDYDSDGVSNLSEQTAGSDPNTISFSLFADNQYVSANPVTLHARIAKGVPFEFALLVDGTNFNSVAWFNYSSSDLSATLATNEGWHGVWVGLRGRNPAAQPVWRWMRFKRDITSPVLALTSPGSPTSLPMIQVKGVSDEPLAGITYDLGSVTNERVFVIDQRYDTNAFEFTTNTFQAYDVTLASGTNVITLRATDLAGNQTVLYFTYLMSPDNNAPVLNLTWPKPDMRLGGSHFTVRGAMDDPAAKVTATLNGQTNNYAGVVERDGKFWLENLPLLAGTNLVTLTAMDAWTNSMTTNFNVVKSGVVLTVTPIPENELWWASVNVAGTISDLGYAVSVNGVAATVNPNGSWNVNNVPFVPGNTTTLNIVTYPPGGNSSSPGAAFIELNQDKGAFTYVDYAYAEIINEGSASEITYNSEGTPVDSWTMNFHTDEAYNWADFIGGNGRWNRITIDGGFYFDNHVDECHAIRCWPAGVWPLLPSGTQTWTGGDCAFIYGGGPFYPPPYPPVKLWFEHCAVADSGTDNWDTRNPETGAGSVGSAPWTYKRNAETTSKHFTGGKDLAKESQMWTAWGKGMEILDPHTVSSDNPPGGRNMEPGELTWGGLGGLDNESLLYAELKNGSTVDATVRAKGIPFMAYERAAAPIKMVAMTVSGATQVGGSNNWAAVKATNGYVILEAVLNGGGTNAAKQIEWTGGEEVPGFLQLRRVSKAQSAHTTVTAKFGPDSFTAGVWIIWADLTVKISGTLDPENHAAILDNGNWPTPASTNYGYGGLGGGNELGTIDFLTNSNLYYAVTIGKVEAKAILQPSGIGNLITNSWNMARHVISIAWDNGGVPSNSNIPLGTNDNSFDESKFLSPATGVLFDLDTPGCSNMLPLTTIVHTSEYYANFYQYVTVNLGGGVQACSATNLWSYSARVDIGNPTNTIQLNSLSTSHITIPTNSFFQTR